MHRRAIAISLLALLLVALLGCSRDDGGPVTSTPSGGQLDFEGEVLRFAAAIEADDFETMATMMSAGFNPDIHFSRRSEIPLVAWPIVARKKESLRRMLELGADPNVAKLLRAAKPAVNGPPAYFDNALMRAVIDPDVEYLEILIEHGGDPNTRGANAETLIDRLLGYDRPLELTEWLISKGADIEIESGGRTLFAETLLSGRYFHALRLLELGANPTPRIRAAAPLGPDRRPLPQPQMPAGGEPHFLYDSDGKLVYETDWRMVEIICWEPQPNPVALDLQQKMQQVLKDRGVACPSQPDRYRVVRENAAAVEQ